MDKAVEGCANVVKELQATADIGRMDFTKEASLKEQPSSVQEAPNTDEEEEATAADNNNERNELCGKTIGSLETGDSKHARRLRLRNSLFRSGLSIQMNVSLKFATC